MANVIYRGPVSHEPETINVPVSGELLPGTVVNKPGSAFETAADATGRLFILSNRRFSGQGPDDAYKDGETAVGYRTETELEFQARFAAGTYVNGDALTVVDGQMTAAGAGGVIVAYYDGYGNTLQDGERDDIVIASNSHVAGA